MKHIYPCRLFDFAGSDGVIDIEDISEPVNRYYYNLYYLVCIGELLAGNYRVEYKLG